jgi:hypothetical protein
MYLDGEKASTPLSRTLDGSKSSGVGFVLHMKSIFSCLKVVFESE